MNGVVEKVHQVTCKVRACGCHLRMTVKDKHAAARALRREGWETREAKWMCPSHVRLEKDKQR